MRYRDVGVFLGIVFALPWLIWVGEQITGVRILFAAAMVCVAIATWVAVKYVWRPSDIRAATAITPLGRTNTIRWCLIAAGLFLVMGALALLINAWTGVGFADLGQVTARDAVTFLGPALLQLVLILPLAFCEEWGWRGYLLNRLREGMGTGPALVVIGVICGVWHLPFYLGPWFSMNADSRESFLPFVVYVVLFGILLGLLRLGAGSIWPAVVAHAVNNTIVFGYLDRLVMPPGARIDPWVAGLSGWQGYLILTVVILVLIRARKLDTFIDK